MGNGDDKFERLMPYYRRVFTYMRARGFSPEDARDLTQDVFLRVYQHMDDYREDARWAYLQSTARHVAFNAIRDKHAGKREGIHVSEETLGTMPDDRVEAADNRLIRGELLDRLYGAVERLDSRQRPCVRLYLEGMSYDEISASLAIGVPTVKSRLNQARKQLREMLKEDLEGFGDSDDQ
jgi:RNA polymerase sigma-70 factor (ECF subfamily)